MSFFVVHQNEVAGPPFLPRRPDFSWGDRNLPVAAGSPPRKREGGHHDPWKSGPAEASVWRGRRGNRGQL